MSDFYQWFYFRVAGAPGREVTLKITNCAGSAYPNGWPDYKGVMSSIGKSGSASTIPAMPTAC